MTSAAIRIPSNGIPTQSRVSDYLSSPHLATQLATTQSLLDPTRRETGRQSPVEFYLWKAALCALLLGATFYGRQEFDCDYARSDVYLIFPADLITEIPESWKLERGNST
jgi:hypothetical protein